MMTFPKNTELPENWVAEPHLSSFALRCPGVTNGAVTINFDRRWWNLGWGYSEISKHIPGCTSHRTKYVGRGWQQKLVDDAVAALLAADQR